MRPLNRRKANVKGLGFCKSSHLPILRSGVVCTYRCKERAELLSGSAGLDKLDCLFLAVHAQQLQAQPERSHRLDAPHLVGLRACMLSMRNAGSGLSNSWSLGVGHDSDGMRSPPCHLSSKRALLKLTGGRVLQSQALGLGELEAHQPQCLPAGPGVA